MLVIGEALFSGAIELWVWVANLQARREHATHDNRNPKHRFVLGTPAAWQGGVANRMELVG